MTDLNTLIPPNSPLYLLYSGGINDRGEITGQASDQSAGTTPAYRATPVPRTTMLWPEGANQRQRIALPQNIRQVLLQRVGLNRR